MVRPHVLLAPDSEAAGGDDGGQGTTDTAPEPIELTEGARIRAPGFDEPIEWTKGGPSGFVPKSDYTKATQRASELEKQYQQAQQQYQQLYQQVSQMQRQQQQGDQAGAQRSARNVNQILKDMRENSYGYATADHMEQLLQAVAPGVNAGQQALAAAGLLWKQIQQMQNGLGSVSQHTAQQEHERFVESIKKEHDVFRDEAGAELLANLLDSYEPAQGETQEQFREAMREKAASLAKRIDKFAESRMKAKSEGAKKAKAVGLAGKGGEGVPSKMLRDKKKQPSRAEDFTRMVKEEGLIDFPDD